MQKPKLDKMTPVSHQRKQEVLQTKRNKKLKISVSEGFWFHPCIAILKKHNNY